jgi:hypothetical protein
MVTGYSFPNFEDVASMLYHHEIGERVACHHFLGAQLNPSNTQPNPPASTLELTRKESPGISLIKLG